MVKSAKGKGSDMLRSLIAGVLALLTVASAASAQADGPFPLCPREGDPCGYVDRTGAWVVEPRFQEAWGFRDGVAWVRQNDRWGLIGRDGRVLSAPRYQSVRGFIEGLAAVQLNDLWGYVDRTGQFVIEPIFRNAESFSEGLAAVSASGLVGYINQRGNFVIEPQFSWGDRFRDGVALADEPGGRRVVIDRTGTVLHRENPFVSSYFSDGLAPARPTQASWGEDGFVDRTGRMVIPARFQFADEFQEGRARVKLNDRWGFIDTSGRMVVDNRFDNVWSFSNGFARVLLNGRIGFIDVNGRFVIEPRFQGAHYHVRADNLVGVMLNGRWGVIDMQGRWVIEPQWHRINIRATDMIHVEFGGGQRRGYIDGSGRPLTFTMEDFLLAEIQSGQTQTAEELARAQAEIERLRAEAAAAQAQAQAAQQRSTACDHVYIGRTFEGRGGVFGMQMTYEVLGFSASTQRVTITTRHDRGLRQEISCHDVPR